jgi:hypothetical protein
MQSTQRLAVWSVFPLITIFSFLTTSIVTNADAQELRPIYDGRKLLEATKVSAQEEALLKRAILPVAAQYWKKKGKDCDAEFEIIDAAQGSFTRATSKQKAVLYRYCMTGHNFALNGIAVLENGEVAAHVVYEGAWDDAIGALPDTNGNGVSEIMIATGGISTAVAWGVISVIELRGKRVSSLGQADTFLDDCQLDEMRNVKKGKSTAYKILVRPGAVLEYYRETFRKGCNDDKNKWKKMGSREKILGRKDAVVYDRLK